VGSVAFIVGSLIVVTIIFLRLKWKHAAALLLITMAGEVVLDLTLKLFFQRARPEAFFNYPLPASYSFPSGHALGSFCFYAVLAWLITSRIKTRGWQILIWIFAPILVFLIGISRIYLGVHFPSDVLAGFTAAFVWILTIAFSDYLFSKRNSEKV
ncbi:MAG: phosphatase PAP2 family protein, partial [Actinomycetota bacterium]